MPPQTDAPAPRPSGYVRLRQWVRDRKGLPDDHRLGTFTFAELDLSLGDLRRLVDEPNERISSPDEREASLERDWNATGEQTCGGSRGETVSAEVRTGADYRDGTPTNYLYNAADVLEHYGHDVLAARLREACPVSAQDARRMAQKIEAACDYPEGMCFTCEQDVAKLNKLAQWLEQHQEGRT